MLVEQAVPLESINYVIQCTHCGARHAFLKSGQSEESTEGSVFLESRFVIPEDITIERVAPYLCDACDNNSQSAYD